MAAQGPSDGSTRSMELALRHCPVRSGRTTAPSVARGEAGGGLKEPRVLFWTR